MRDTTYCNPRKPPDTRILIPRSITFINSDKISHSLYNVVRLLHQF